MVLAIQFYDVVLAAHIALLLIAFGVTFSYPVTLSLALRSYPRSMPAVHAMQAAVGKRLIAPAGGLALLAGAYLASDRDLWSEVWVVVPLIILLGLLISGGAYFGRTEEKLQALAERDIAASAGDGPVSWSQEYMNTLSGLRTAGLLGSASVLVAVFFMTAKPFA